MGERTENDSSAKNYSWVLALEAPSRMKQHINEKNTGTRRDILNINQGQDITEEVLTYFQNSANSSRNSNGCARMGVILHASGSVLHPKMDVECSSISDKGSYKIKRLDGRYVISEDGQVQHEPLTISCIGSSGLLIKDQVNSNLVAATPVQVTVVSFVLNQR